MSRRIAVVTVARSDWGLYHPIVRAMLDDAALEPLVIAAAAHLLPAHGATLRDIEADGIPVADTVDLLLAGDSGAAVAGSIGLGVLRLSDSYRRLDPDLVLLLGDRSEMLAAAVAAVPMGIPIAHIHGGEITAGAIDDAWRHAITKLSHLHFPATAGYAARIRQLGEEPWRIHLSGSPAVDNLLAAPAVGRAELSAALGCDVGEAVLVTYHPVTLEAAQTRQQVDALLEALADVPNPLIFTAPNADHGHSTVRERIEAFVAGHGRARLVPSVGRERYPSLLRHVRAMVGNSSSGLIEAPSFGLPVVNVGNRQDGRERAANVIDVDDDAARIRQAITRALDPAFRATLAGLENPYGDGHAAARITRVLAELAIDHRLLAKRFADLGPEGEA